MVGELLSFVVSLTFGGCTSPLAVRLRDVIAQRAMNLKRIRNPRSQPPLLDSASVSQLGRRCTAMPHTCRGNRVPDCWIATNFCPRAATSWRNLFKRRSILLQIIMEISRRSTFEIETSLLTIYHPLSLRRKSLGVPAQDLRLRLRDCRAPKFCGDDELQLVSWRAPNAPNADISPMVVPLSWTAGTRSTRGNRGIYTAAICLYFGSRRSSRRQPVPYSKDWSSKSTVVGAS